MQMESSCFLRNRFGEHLATLLKIVRVQNVGFDRFLKGVAISRDGVPGLIEAIVALVISMRIGRKPSAGHATNCRYRPMRKDACIWPGLQFVDDFFNRDDSPLRSQYCLFLHAKNSPQ